MPLWEIVSLLNYYIDYGVGLKLCIGDKTYELSELIAQTNNTIEIRVLTEKED